MTEKIRLFLSDMDGVMTDGLIHYSTDGSFSKAFHVHDGVGMLRLNALGIKTGIITSETSSVVEARAARLKVDFLCMGKQMGYKLAAAEEICQQLDISLKEVSYIGDDVNCLDLLQKVGHPACPPNSHHLIKEIAGIHQTRKAGGEGALREWIDHLLQQQLFKQG